MDGENNGQNELDELKQDEIGDKFTEGKVDLVDLIDQPAWKTILIDLVKSAKMDPWNIDVSELADKYLQKINALEGSDLRLPANAILASAILLKFKSRILNIGSIEDEEEFLAKRKMGEDEMKLIDGLLPELKTTSKAKEGRVSLDDLVDSIEKMLQKSKKKKGVLIRDVEKPEFQIPINEFDIGERVEEVYIMINEKVDS
ncbi:MAG: segregation/condensation protein A, partial [Candidatus Diapherotrites archaeon]